MWSYNENLSFDRISFYVEQISFYYRRRKILFIGSRRYFWAVLVNDHAFMPNGSWRFFSTTQRGEETLTFFIQRSCSPCLVTRATIRSPAKVAACEITRIYTIKGVREPMRHMDYMVSEYSRTGRFRVPRFLREIITTFWDRVWDVTDIIRGGSINSFHERDRTFQLGYFFCSHTPSPNQIPVSICTIDTTDILLDILFFFSSELIGEIKIYS